MTTHTAATPAPSTSRVDGAFARVSRATGYGRVGVGPLASDGAGVTLVLPVESIVAVDARTRPAAGTSVAAVGPERLHDAAHRAAKVTLEAFGLRAEARVTVRPMVSAAHPHAAEATALATVNAICRAEELAPSPTVRAELVRQAVPGALGLAFGEPAIVKDGTGVIHAAHEAARLHLVVATPEKGSPLAGAFGQLVAPPQDPQDEHAIAQWLLSCSGDGDSPALTAVRAAVGAHDVLAVIGGHDPAAPVVVLLASNAGVLRQGQAVCGAMTTALAPLAEGPQGRWRVALARLAAHTAAL